MSELASDKLLHFSCKTAIFVIIKSFSLITLTMKRIIAFGALTLALLMPASVAAAYNCLTINRIDGKSDHFAIDSSTTISMSENGGVTLAGRAVTVIYSPEEVDSYTFENFTFSSSEKYDGDKDDVSGIKTPSSFDSVLTFSSSDGVLTVEGASADSEITLVGLNGTVVGVTRADANGSASISAAPGQIYLLVVNGSTIKIKL